MGRFNRGDRSGSRRDFGRRDFGRRNFGDRGGGREMHQAVCSNCGRDCQVPFAPTGNKPVYCNECFRNQGGRSESRRFQDRSPSKPDFENRNEQFETINRKLDKILEMLATTSPKGEKKTKTPKKKTPVTKE